MIVSVSIVHVLTPDSVESMEIPGSGVKPTCPFPVTRSTSYPSFLKLVVGGECRDRPGNRRRIGSSCGPTSARLRRSPS